MKKYLLVIGISTLAFNAYAGSESECAEDEMYNSAWTRCVKKAGSCNWNGSVNCKYEMDDDWNVKVSAGVGKTTTIGGWGYFYRTHIPINNLVLDETVTWVDLAGASENTIYCKKGSAVCSGPIKSKPTYPYEIDENTGQVVVYNMSDDSIRAVYDDWNNLYKDEASDSYEKYDEATGMRRTYNGRGALLSTSKQNDDGSVYTYDENGKLKSIKGKKIYTVEEAEAVTANGDKFRVQLTYK